ncbi:uncharacterized protein PGTG_16987 [Puccinia graminis f. sp. tritici CRL 75-36-700-3]|uniref:Uncharacterized protein n=1 Tax=Puccinia graminis f. sp. tritici (strain CRL 75-36-700-3 / race SCCL) TaxID=418459 RepID=E3L458_PUCGT|nr:uncharacterized protein PGTG_16987 [Puccinia graminis f. sp. tritici CRL 75-36-700-3]EFP91333.2 hypothetical protein PGTG_16987 [Puccinia graminis f. sp. tritici CRL 75-36-700-3]
MIDTSDGALPRTEDAGHSAELLQRTDQEGFRAEVYWLPSFNRRRANGISESHSASPPAPPDSKSKRPVNEGRFRNLFKRLAFDCWGGPSGTLTDPALGPVILFEERYAEIVGRKRDDERLELVDEAFRYILLSISMSRTEAVGWVSIFSGLLAHYRGSQRLPTSLVYGLHSLLLKHLSDPTLSSSICDLLLEILTTINPRVRPLLIAKWSQGNLEKLVKIISAEPTLSVLLAGLQAKRVDEILGGFGVIGDIFSARAPGYFSSQTRVASIAVLFHLIGMGIPKITEEAISISKALLVNDEEYFLLGHERALLDKILSDYKEATSDREHTNILTGSQIFTVQSQELFLRTTEKGIWSKPYWFPGFDQFAELSLAEQMEDFHARLGGSGQTADRQSVIDTIEPESRRRAWGSQLSLNPSEEIPAGSIASNGELGVLKFFKERCQDLQRTSCPNEALLRLVQRALLYILQLPKLSSTSLKGWLTQLKALAINTSRDHELLTTIFYGFYSIHLKLSHDNQLENPVRPFLDLLISSIPINILREVQGEWSRELFNPTLGLSPKFRDWKELNKIIVNEPTLEKLRMCLNHQEHERIEQHMSSLERIFSGPESVGFSAETRVASIALLAHLIAIPEPRLAEFPLGLSTWLLAETRLLFPHERLLLASILQDVNHLTRSP